MAAGEPHPDASAAAGDGQGAADAARAGVQPSGQAVEGDGNQLLSQLSAGRDLTLGDSVAGDKIAGDKVVRDKVIGDKIEIVVADPQQAADVARSLRWSWPQPLDFGPYRSFRREGFVGRSWLFEEVRAWAMADGAAAGRPRAQLIEAEYGVGKSAFLAELVDTQAAGIPVVAQHFCQFDAIATLAPGRFVSSIAAQLAAALPAYRAAIEAEAAAGLRQLLEAQDNDPIGAFDQAVLAPLEAMPPPAGPLLLVVDALDEALEHRPSNDKAARVTIVSLLGQRAQRFPRWLRLLATARPLPAVQQPLRQAFSLHSLNAEEARNLADLEAYAEARCQQPPLAALLAAAGLGAAEVATRLRTLSGGKFLYVAFVLNDLASGALPLSERGDLEALPSGMDDFYLQAFERRFPSDQAYDQVRELLALHSVQRDPLSRRELAAILNWKEVRLLGQQQQLHDLLRLRRNDPAYGPNEFLASFNHPSLSRWLIATDEHSGYPRAGRFCIDPEAAEAAIHRWALAELEAQKAHTWPYLVRHLTSHLTAEERPVVIAGLLGQFAWLEARLRLAGINALLGDFTLATPAPWLGQLEQAIRQSSHVLSRSKGWFGHTQLASQITARLPGLTAYEDGKTSQLLMEAKQWIFKNSSATPLITRKRVPTGLDQSLLQCEWVEDIIGLYNGSIAALTRDHILLLSPQDPGLISKFPVNNGTNTLALLDEDHLVLASKVKKDGKRYNSKTNLISIWSIGDKKCVSELMAPDGVNAIAVLGPGELAWAGPTTIHTWSLAKSAKPLVLGQCNQEIVSLLALTNGQIASLSLNGIVNIWHPTRNNPTISFQTSGQISREVSMFFLHTRQLLMITSNSRKASCYDIGTGNLSYSFRFDVADNGFTMLANGEIAGYSFWDSMLEIRNSIDGSLAGITQDDSYQLKCISSLTDGRFVSGPRNGWIRIWDTKKIIEQRLDKKTFFHKSSKDSIDIILTLSGNLIATLGSENVEIWNTENITDTPIASKDITGPGRDLVELSDGCLAISCGWGGEIQIWNPATNKSSIIRTQSHPLKSYVRRLVSLASNMLAAFESDNAVEIWDVATGICINTFSGKQITIECGRLWIDGQAVDFLTGLRLGQDYPFADLIHVDANGNLIFSIDETIQVKKTINDFFPLVVKKSLLDALGCQKLVPVITSNAKRVATIGRHNAIFLLDSTCSIGDTSPIFVSDNIIKSLAYLPERNVLIAGDDCGRLIWLELEL